MKLRRRFAGESRGRCLLTNLGTGQGAALRAAGNERRAGLVTTDTPFTCPTAGSQATRSLVRQQLVRKADFLPHELLDGVMTAASKEGLCTGPEKSSRPRGRKASEQGSHRQRRRRSEDGRWAHSSGEPPVTRWDSAKSRRVRGGGEPARIAKERPHRSRWEPSRSRRRRRSEAGRP